MAIGKTPTERLAEYLGFAEIVKRTVQKTPFLAPFALQINASCPNVGLNLDAVVSETCSALEIFEPLNNPLIIKVNALISPEAAKSIMSRSACDAITCSNTIPWGKLPHLICWKDLFGTSTSPLEHLGGGGLSGAPLLPIVCDWISKAREVGITKPIIGCGGILSKQDATAMLDSGASAIEIGSAAFLRPWRVAGIISHTNQEMFRRNACAPTSTPKGDSR